MCHSVREVGGGVAVWVKKWGDFFKGRLGAINFIPIIALVWYLMVLKSMSLLFFFYCPVFVYKGSFTLLDETM